MPPSGGFRTSLTYQVNGAAMAAFQPSNGVFSPGLPLQPVSPQPTRLIDFQVGVNTIIPPRGGYADIHSFASLRAFADVELVRLAIETCKDQIERLDWKVKAVDGKKGATASDARIGQLTKFFRKPDGVTPFATWLRQLMEDLLVLDAPAFEKLRDRAGRLIGLEIVPGDTIKILVDENGRRPRAPVPAYQQIIKGMVWNNLTADDLSYAPRNPRPNRLYGFGPVEQIIISINTLLRRQTVQLGYFTEGNMPAGILNVPAGWQADAIKTMQDAWDARMEGYLPGKSKLQWVPEGTKYQPFKDSPLKDDFDEWLARVICFAFSLPPTAFVKQMNRATGEQASDSGKEEGVESRKLWWKRAADDIIQEEFGYTDLEWGWNDDVVVDPQKRAAIDDLNLKNGSTTINEVRDGRGQDVIEGGEQPMIYLPTGPVLLKDVAKQAEQAADVPPPTTTDAPKPEEPGAQPKPEDASATPLAADHAHEAPASKLAKGADRTSVHRPLVRRAEAGTRKKIAAVLHRAGDDVAAQVEDQLKRLGKAAAGGDDPVSTGWADHVAQTVSLDEFDDIDISDALFGVAYDSAEGVLSQFGGATDALTNQVDKAAVAYAKRRSAELVSVQGPNNIVATTRSAIRNVIAKGLEDNIGSRGIADAIQASQAFSAERAETIAKTEIRTANTQGMLAGGRAAKSEDDLTIEKSWLPASDGCCDVCQDNADAGWIDIDEDFPSGDDGTPGHPNCSCDTAMRATSADDADSETDSEED